ncbi:M20 metallopeptidase family protein [Limisalsivibrio acetivorans]|uniref:M20 metallopeptidase family protein n=1 Tax=Limisalsivibrio acetivorans TaxID=1304888 RepID=UPI0003FCD3D5|nr:M20 family metallopeptidase [Limisalsivibrio acetivorans]
MKSITPSERETALKVMAELAELAEPSFKEFKTTAYIKEFLESIGITPDNVYETGIWGTVDNGSDKTVALRSDIDALPFNEDKTEYRHLCGHNHNMTAVLMALKWIMENRDSLNVNIRYIFQPAEEMVSGASTMIERGCLEGVSCIYAMHAENEIPVGRAGVVRGPCMAGSNHFDIVFKGSATHAALPHKGTDTVSAAAYYINNAQTIVGRLCNPTMPALISFGSINGGSAANILPDSVRVMGTFRHFHLEIKEALVDGMQRLCASVKELFGVEAHLTIKDGTPPVVNDRELAEGIIERLDADLRFSFDKPSMGGEDFAFYLEHVPGVFIWSGANESGSHPPLHSPDFYVPDETVVTSMRIMRCVLDGYMKG